MKIFTNEQGYTFPEVCRLRALFFFKFDVFLERFLHPKYVKFWTQKTTPEHAQILTQFPNENPLKNPEK